MLDVSDPIAWLIPCFLALAFVEFLLTRRGSRPRFCAHEFGTFAGEDAAFILASPWTRMAREAAAAPGPLAAIAGIFSSPAGGGSR